MHRRSTRCAASIALATWAIVCLLAAAPAANAAESAWRNPDGGTFSSASNWSGGVPGASDKAGFGLSTPGILGALPPYTVSFTADATNQSLRVLDDRVTFDVNDHIYTTTDASIAMQLGTVSGASGRLAVMDGIVILPFQSELQIATTGGGSGLLAVAAGGLVIGSPVLTVGLNGNGTLNIFDNGDLIADDTTLGLNSNVTGTATITGAGSSLLADELIVGSSGTGVLNVTGGGRVDSTDGLIGDEVGGIGAVTVSGANSRWQMSHWLEVGLSGEGTLRIEAGGTVRDQVGLVKGSAVVTGGSTWINDGVLNIGRSSTSIGELTIESGSHVQSGNSNLAISGGGKAIAIVRDSGTTWTNTDALNVGLAGEGDLTIESGAAVTSVGGGVAVTGGSQGTARITGSTSTWTTSGEFSVGAGGVGQLDVNSGQLLFTNENDLIVGNGGSGQMTISSGGQALDAFETVVGKLAGSTGELTVTGSGSQLRTLDRLTIGSGGRGTLLVSNGGRVTNDVAILSGVDSSVRVQGANSTWENGSILNLFSNAAIVIEEGGTVSSVGSNIGVSAGDTSEVTVSNATWSNSSFLNVGSAGAGSLSIEAGGQVSNLDASIGALSGSNGTVFVNGAGSTWTIHGNLHVGNSGINNGGVGTLRIEAGGTVVVDGSTKLHQGDLVVLEGGTLSTLLIDFLQGQGTFQWTSGTLHLVQFDGNLLVPNGGVFVPGTIAAPEQFVMIFGGYTQRAGATLEIDGLSTFVNVADTAALDGALALNLNGAVPNPSFNYTIFDALSIAGSFANVVNGQRLTTSDGLGSFVVNYGAGSPFDTTQIVLSAFQVTPIPGDYNQNGTVDAADYTVWRDHLGTSFSLPNETASIGTVDGEDYAVWKSNFGNGSGTGSIAVQDANSTVPEPSSFIALVIAALLVASTGSQRYARSPGTRWAGTTPVSF